MSASRLDCSPLGMVMNIVKTSRDTNGRSLEMEWELLPNSGGTPVHIHPYAIESYEVLSGEVEIYKDGEWHTAKAGEKVIIEKGVPHTFRNASSEVARVYNVHEPAMEFENFFKDLHTFSQSGLAKNGRMNFKAVVGISSLWTKYPGELRSVKPPYFVMKILGAYGRLRGMNFY